jgi:hypothetical protein
MTTTDLPDIPKATVTSRGNLVITVWIGSVKVDLRVTEILVPPSGFPF